MEHGMQRQRRADTLTMALVAGALCLSALAATSSRRNTPPVIGGDVHRVPDWWPSLVSQGHRFGSPAAMVRIVEFADFTCKYCVRQHTALRRVLDAFPHHVSLTYRHFSSTTAGYTLALASECAASQGRFAEFHDGVFERQASGKRLARWEDLPSGAELGSLDALRQCADERRYDERVQADIAQANRLALTGTPTLFINGKRLKGFQSEALLRRHVIGELSILDPNRR
jgi:protein-disulfide isomerase